jgi:hypothetical protein
MELQAATSTDWPRRTFSTTQAATRETEQANRMALSQKDTSIKIAKEKVAIKTKSNTADLLFGSVCLYLSLGVRICWQGCGIPI